MKLKPVESSNLAAVGYDPKVKRLEVKFQSGGTYSYAGVSARKVANLLKAESIGSYFEKKIAYDYEYKKVK